MAGAHDGHRERLRQRFRETGLAGFAPHEALELILTYCIPQKDVNPLAHQLIERFGSFSQALDAPVDELAKVPGLGQYSATFLSLVGQAAGYYQRDKYAQKPELMNCAALGEYCSALFINRNEENLYLISLNIQGQLLSSTLIATGALDELVIYPRNVVNAALRSNAYAVALTHNHPGGSLYPSRADIDTTNDVINALNAVDIPLLDHIIVAAGRYVSLAQQGYLADAARCCPNNMVNAYLRQFNN